MQQTSFHKFSGGDTPGPSQQEGATPSRTNTQPGLQAPRCWDQDFGPPQLFSRGCAPAVVRPMQKLIENWKFEPLQNRTHLHARLRRQDYPICKFWFQSVNNGLLPRRNCTTLWFCWLFCPYLFLNTAPMVEPLDRFSLFAARTTCFGVRMVFLFFWGGGMWKLSAAKL